MWSATFSFIIPSWLTSRKKEDDTTAQHHWQAAYDSLKGIQSRGLHLSPGDLEVLELLK